MRLLTDDYAIAEDRGSSGVTVTYSPPLKFVGWPLRVGEITETLVTITASTGQSVTIRFKGQVVSYGPVRTAAGTFMGFKIVGSANGTPFRESWYAPEVRNEVRVVERTSLFRSVTLDLIDYQKSDEPVVEAEWGTRSRRPSSSPSSPVAMLPTEESSATLTPTQRAAELGAAQVSAPTLPAGARLKGMKVDLCPTPGVSVYVHFYDVVGEGGQEEWQTMGYVVAKGSQPDYREPILWAIFEGNELKAAYVAIPSKPIEQLPGGLSLQAHYLTLCDEAASYIRDR